MAYMKGSRSAITIPLLFSLLAAAIIMACDSRALAEPSPRATKGVLDLSSWDFSHDGPVKLHGQWEFYWGMLHDQGMLKPGPVPLLTGYIKVPSIWTEQKVGARPLPVTGMATYRLKILLPEQAPANLSIRMPAVDTAYRLFVNGEKLYENGPIGATGKSSKPVHYMPVLIEFHPTKETSIVIHVSNFHYPRPGLRDEIILDEKKALVEKKESLLIVDIFLIGSIFMMFMYHLGFYYLRRKDLSSLYFSLFCLCTVGRLAVIGEGYAYRFPWFTWNMGTAAEYIFYYCCVLTCALYMRSLYPREIPALAIRIIAAVCAVFTLIVAASPIMIYARTLIAFNLFVGLLILLFIYYISLAIARKREEANIFLAGTVILFMTVTNDILYNYRVIQTTYMMAYGLFMFFFVQSFLLSSRVSRAFSTAEELSRDLEIKVTERTRELEIERNKLQARNTEIEREINMARMIQEHLIPSTSPWNSICSLYRAMRAVGGDFFDFIQFRDQDRIGIFLSDVTGHGVPAAFITSMIKTIILQAGERKNNPSELLQYINEVIFSQTGDNFITAFYCVYDASARTLRYANAGHNYPYIITPGGVSELRGSSSLPIGIMDNELMIQEGKAYVTNEVTLPSGGKLFMYTDGLSEASPVKGHQLMFEENGLAEALRQLAALPCGGFVDQLFKRLVQYRGSDSFEDDVCIICLEIE